MYGCKLTHPFNLNWLDSRLCMEALLSTCFWQFYEILTLLNTYWICKHSRTMHIWFEFQKFPSYNNFWYYHHQVHHLNYLSINLLKSPCFYLINATFVVMLLKRSTDLHMVMLLVKLWKPMPLLWCIVVFSTDSLVADIIWTRQGN